MRLHLVVLVASVLVGAGRAQSVRPDVSLLDSEEIARAQTEARAGLARAERAQDEGDAETARAETGGVLELLAPLPIGEGHDATVEILWRIGSVAYLIGDSAMARDAWSRVVRHREQTLPADDQDLFRARLNLGGMLVETGEAANARTLLEIALADAADTLPPDHREVLFARDNLATAMAALGELAEARALQEMVIATYERTLSPDDPDLLFARRNLCVTLRRIGDLEGRRAVEEALLATYERTRPADHRDVQRAREDLAYTLYELRDYAGARALEEAALASYERTLGADADPALALRENHAFTLVELGDLEGARALQEALLTERERVLPPNHPDLLVIRGDLALTLIKMGELAEAVALQQSVLAAREGTLPEDDPDLLDARQKLGDTLTGMGEVATARALLESVVLARERTLHPDHPDLLDARRDLANTLKELNDLEGARALYESVAEAYEQTLPPDARSLMVVRLNLATVLKMQGDLWGARALEETVLEAFERTLAEDDPVLASARLKFAGTISETGDKAGARALLESVVASRERTLPADHPDILSARMKLATTLSVLGEESARAMAESVLATRERLLPPEHPDVVDTRSNLAFVLFNMGEMEAARAHYAAVFAVQERTLPEGNTKRLLSRMNLAITTRAVGDNVGASAHFAAVLAGFEDTLPRDDLDLTSVRINLGASLAELGDPAGAGVQGIELARGVLMRLERAWWLSPREARALAGDEAPRHSAARNLTEFVARDVAAPLRFELAETLRATSVAPRGRTAEDDPRLDELAGLRTRLNDLVGGGPAEGESTEAFAEEIGHLTLERDRLERELRRELGSAQVGVGPIRASDVARTLGPDAAAVGFLRIEKWALDPQSSSTRSAGDVLAAHVLSSDGSLTELELGAAEELAELAREWRTALGKPIERGFVPEENEIDGERVAGDTLRARVLDPILAALGDETTLHVCLDDFLHLVPLGALPHGDHDGNDPRVYDRYEVVNEVSFARLLSKRERLEVEPGLLAMGGVTFDAELDSPLVQASADRGDRSARPDTFAPLLQTRFEAETVWALFEEEVSEDAEAVLLTKKKATKAAFHEHAPGKQYLHIATHGWFAPETIPSTLDASRSAGEPSSRMDATEAVTGLAPMTLCGLAFAGANRRRDAFGRVPGILTAEELAGVDLGACELAVLSACETNVGLRRAGQGVQSLQAALHAAGARSAITSLWKVDDAATRRLMERFYTYLWGEELSKSEALARAQRDLRADGAPVRDWAGWVLSGDPR